MAQRVSRAEVRVGEESVGRIGRGFLLLVGVGAGDGPGEMQWMAEKVAGLRVFPDAEGKMNLDLAGVGGEVLAVSQFTLYGDCRKGRRPSFTDAAPPEEAERLFDAFVAALRDRGLHVETGRFGEVMKVDLTNEGPVTLLIEKSGAAVSEAPAAERSGAAVPRRDPEAP